MSQRANSSKPKAILPESLAQNGKTMRNIKKWSIDDICIYNEANMHQKQFALVKYSCEQVGQRMSTKRHAGKCNTCDVSDLRIEVMDRENKEWIEARGDDKFVGFQKGKGTKRKKKKQKDPKQPGITQWLFGQNSTDVEEKKSNDNDNRNHNLNRNDNRPNDKWECLENKTHGNVKEPSQLLVRYGHDGLCLFEEDLITMHCENCDTTVGNKSGYDWNDKKQRQAMRVSCYQHFDERSSKRHLKEPRAWQGIIKRSTKIMATMFYTLIRMIQDNIGDQKWYVI